MISGFVDRRLAGVLILLLALGGVHASDKWVRVSNTHGWSISYLPSWEAYVMQAPDSGRELSIQESDNANFDGPKGCYERKEPCGHFQISSWDSEKPNPHLDLKTYVDEDTQDPTVISKEAGKLDGMPAYFIKLPNLRVVYVKYKGFVFHIEYGPAPLVTRQIKRWKKLLAG